MFDLVIELSRIVLRPGMWLWHQLSNGAHSAVRMCASVFHHGSRRSMIEIWISDTSCSSSTGRLLPWGLSVLSPRSSPWQDISTATELSPHAADYGDALSADARWSASRSSVSRTIRLPFSRS